MLKDNFPLVASHVEDLGFDASFATFNWYLSLFVNTMPLETCLRVWDVFFLERNASVLFRVSLALIDTFQEVLPLSSCSPYALSLPSASP